VLLTKVSHLTLRSPPQNNQGSKGAAAGKLQLAGKTLELVFGSTALDTTSFKLQSWQPAAPNKKVITTTSADRTELDDTAAQTMAAKVLNAPLPRAVGVTRLVV
jgi:hypothetical protein